MAAGLVAGGVWWVGCERHRVCARDTAWLAAACGGARRRPVGGGCARACACVVLWLVQG